jgi:hypothetical protein
VKIIRIIFISRIPISSRWDSFSQIIFIIAAYRNIRIGNKWRYSISTSLQYPRVIQRPARIEEIELKTGSFRSNGL